MAGSIAPDFEFFLRLTPNRLIGHTWAGIFIFCLPVGATLLLLFHFILKRPLIALMPNYHHERLIHFARSHPFYASRRLGNIALSIILGAVTHLVWDSFTHPDGWFPIHIPLLSGTLFEIHGIGTVRVYFAAQYLTSLAGIIALLYWYRKWLAGLKPAIGSNRRFSCLKRLSIIASLFAVSFTGGVAYGFNALSPIDDITTLMNFISHATIAGVSFFLVGMVFFSIIWHLFIKRKAESSSTHPPSGHGRHQSLPLIERG